ncbi:Signal transduction histidine kinase [Caloramator quimbayensis]|uniref:histidine kinase n=1 Tax=Caloramator quimbayensis TaxID=1147123 RepID=A0A1T4YAE0_9CLOT|nr:PocR ligand-binding domain-containing protein [Caloramator quimbayensis]SKA98749.1 Signal transduction histidine kinase [Caloramator quimbayensis]
MGCQLENYFDAEKIKKLIDSIHRISGIPIGLFNADGKRIYTSLGWKEFCTKFGTFNAKIGEKSIECNKNLFEIIKDNAECKIYTCLNGLSYIVVPIYINNTYDASIIHGQFFLKELNIDNYNAIAKEYGFDEKEYVKALSDIPVISYEKARNLMEFFNIISNIIMSVAEKRLAQVEIFKELNQNNKILEMMNIELIKTEEKLFAQYNKVLESEKYKTDFFANISHELRTPVNVIHSALQMARLIVDKETDFEDRERLIKYFDVMRQNSYRLIRLVNNLIDITKIDAKYVSLNLVNCDIIDFVKSITLSVEEYAIFKDVDLFFDSDEDSRVIVCDPQKIERILLNLLSNAIKYNKKDGSVHVIIRNDNDSITICVKDTGIGIPQDKQDRIFERFVQVDENSNKSYEGSGIGLSIVKSLVELHKGRIYLKSELGAGSEFYIELPANLKVTDEKQKDKIYGFDYYDSIERLNIEFWDVC